MRLQVKCAFLGHDRKTIFVGGNRSVFHRTSHFERAGPFAANDAVHVFDEHGFPRIQMPRLGPANSIKFTVEGVVDDEHKSFCRCCFARVRMLDERATAATGWIFSHVEKLFEFLLFEKLLVFDHFLGELGVEDEFHLLFRIDGGEELEKRGEREAKERRKKEKERARERERGRKTSESNRIESASASTSTSNE